MDKDKLDIGTATRPCQGFTYNGDHYFIKEIGSLYMVSVIDGIGHGKPAAEASDIAVDCLEARWNADVEWFYRTCDQILEGTRGVVIGVAMIDMERDLIEYTGIGNIETQIYVDNSVETLISSYGIVGDRRLPHIKIRRAQFPPGAMLIMYSDGISSKFSIREYYGLKDQTAQFIADVLMRDWGRTTDDATVVVVKRGSDNGI